jgi:hypothetical protein
VAEETVRGMRSACVYPDISETSEDYTILTIDATEPAASAIELKKHVDLPRVLLGETQNISDQERENLQEHSFSWNPANLVVLSWNVAILFGVDESSDVPDLLEVASMQLLELRAYDELVGRYLDRLYDEIGHGPLGWYRASRYQRLSRTTMQLFVDITEITERVDNALQWLGDTWLARVHRGAARAFEIPRWQRQLEHKLELLRQINELVVDQLTTRQSMRLEASIAILIIIEIFILVFEMF